MQAFLFAIEEINNRYPAVGIEYLLRSGEPSNIETSFNVAFFYFLRVKRSSNVISGKIR